MKRQDNVNKLLKEGFSKETLVNFSDKQLDKLVSMLSETLNIQKDDKLAIDKAKKEKKEFDTYEGDVNEKKSKISKTDAKKIIKKGADVKNMGDPVAWQKKERKERDIDESKPSAGLSKKKKSAIVKKAKKGGDIGKKGKNFKEVEANAKKSGAKDPKAVAAAAMWKKAAKQSNESWEHPVTPKFVKKQHINKGFEVVGKKDKAAIMEWVNELANKKYTSLTLKKEIMEMVTTKVNEEGKKLRRKQTAIPNFMTYDEIKASGAAEPAVKPKEPVTKPGTTPKRRTPYQPGPGINPRPKAMGDNKLK